MSVKTLIELMRMIELPKIVQNELVSMEPMLSQQKKNEETLIQNLTHPNHWESSRIYLKKSLSPDKNGYKMLSYMLSAASYSLEKYEDKGISEDIFIDTMKCFTRFTKEHYESYGFYGFDRDFWTGRQLSLQLFRLGELEFEKSYENNQKIISVHIPSDAVLTEENCKKSLKMAAEFFSKEDCSYEHVPYFCNSWLLSPALKTLLPEHSNILKFQNLFAVESVDENSTEYLTWIFKRSDLDIKDLPENTSLQRNAKKYLLKGGKIGEGKGYLKHI